MNLNVIYTGGSNTLMYSDIVVVKKKPGPLNVNTISDYLSTYNVEDIKEGKLRPVPLGGAEFFIYDLNDLKVMTYDLLIYVSTPTSFDGSGLPSNQLEGIGYIELTEIGLANLTTHEVVKIKYNLIEGVDYNTRLTLDYTEGTVNNLNYLTEESNSNFRSYSKEYISKNISLAPKVGNFFESYNTLDTIAPIYKGYLYNKNYYEIENLRLNLSYGINQITNLRIHLHEGDDWLEVSYSNKETILHNITRSPVIHGPLITVALNPLALFTKLVVWTFATEAHINPSSMCYKSNPSGVWYLTRTDYPIEMKLNNVYRDRLNSDLSPGYNLNIENQGFIYSRAGNGNANWCLNKEVRDRMNSLNIYTSNLNSASILWENSPLKSYKLLETDMECFILMEYNSTANITKAYFSDRTSLIIPANSKFRIIGGGELMVKTENGFNIYQGSANKVKSIDNVFDLIELYFSSFDSMISTISLTYENTLIHRGKFYTLDENYLLT